ncbi:hypothetical protein C8R45DRAFT_929020 [Mycena sanguinolenta]|nr:hypothetical protein C8R45DRAFT_929020 [Mycena sanguinolenta]
MDKPRLERPVVKTIEHLTPSLLGTIINNPAVAGFEAENGQVGEVYRLRVHYSDEKGNSPATVVLKINLRSHASGVSMACVPGCYYSAYDKDSGSFALLLEDVGADALVGNDLHRATLAQAHLASEQRRAGVAGNNGIVTVLTRDSPKFSASEKSFELLRRPQERDAQRS